jgi:hypothetical protein
VSSVGRIGFTGTSEGMTDLQKISLVKFLEDMKAKGAHSFHHGDCVGADEQAHHIALEMGYCIVIWPPVKQEKRAYCTGACSIMTPDSYFARNRSIVDNTDILVGASVADRPLARGGTWYTIDYALKSKDAYVIWPAGALSLMLRKM